MQTPCRLYVIMSKEDNTRM